MFECGGPSDDACSTNVAATSSMSSSIHRKKKCSRPAPISRLNVMRPACIVATSGPHLAKHSFNVEENAMSGPTLVALGWGKKKRISHASVFDKLKLF